MRQKIIGVMGSGQNAREPFSSQVGTLIAQSGFNLLTGGGKGVMEAVSKAFVEHPDRKGLCIGIVPTESSANGCFINKDGYPNPYIELCISSPLGTFTGDDPEQISRNHINIMSSDAIIALPGNKGTLNEIDLAQKFQKPILLFGPVQSFENFKIQTSDNIEDVARFLSDVIA